MYGSKVSRYTLETLCMYSYHKIIRYPLEIPKAKISKIQFGHLIVLISPISHHAPSHPNLK